jgi:hypothetical protein
MINRFLKALLVTLGVPAAVIGFYMGAILILFLIIRLLLSLEPE